MPAPSDRRDHRVTRTGVRDRTRLGRRLLRGASSGVGGLLGLVLVAVTVTAILEARDRRRVLPPGDLVDLADGRRLHLHVDGPSDGGCTGASNRPAVVLEAGSGGFSASMAWLHHELAAHTRVVAYDRAGYGFSDPPALPLDAASVAGDLHEALQRRGLDGPYLLVLVERVVMHTPERLGQLVLGHGVQAVAVDHRRSSGRMNHPGRLDGRVESRLRRAPWCGRLLGAVGHRLGAGGSVSW